MRVAFDATVSGRAQTGVEVYARALFPALHATGVDVRWWQHPLTPAHRRWHRARNGVGLTSWLMRGARRRVREESVAVFHATTAIGPLAMPCPLVLTVHDATTVTAPLKRGPADRAFQRLFAVESARRAAAILTPTRVAADAVTDAFGLRPERVHVVPLGVDRRFFESTADDVQRVRSTYALTRPYVLYVGASTPRKNLPTLVRAMRLVGRRFPDVELILAGPAPPLPDPWTPDGVRRLGHVRDQDLPALYAGATAMAYVSRCEGFGLPVLEAMAAGAPVVTSAGTAMAEVVGDAALLVQPDEVDDIAAAIERLLSDGMLRQTLVTRGRRRSVPFTWSATAVATAAVYAHVAGSPHSSLCALSPGPATRPASSPSALAP